MKKTLTINLNNIVFHIDDDAYDMLQNYLSDVEKHLSEDERKEVMADIEARIAEIFNESLKRNKTVINIEDVEEIINVLGKPNQYSDDEEQEETGEPKAAHQASSNEKRSGRRFYRDPENAVLGGVSAGIAAYFNWDVTWVRIVLVLLTLISAGNMILIYFIAWLIAPKAVTTAQRLEMQGEDVTVENIKSEINNVKNYVESDKFKQSASGFGDRFIEVVRTIVKVLAGLVGGILAFVGIVTAIALVFALITLLWIPGLITGFSPELANEISTLTGDNGVLLVTSLVLVIGAPIFLIIYWAFNLIGRRRYEHSKSTSLVVLILWVAGLFMLYSVGLKSIPNITKINRHFEIIMDEDTSAMTDQERTVEPFTELEVSNNIEVELTQDSARSVVISAHENSINKVITRVDNGKLKIYTERFILSEPVKVRISVDSLFVINGSGATQFNTITPFNVSNLTLKLSGASSGDLEFIVAGTSKIDLSGAAKANLNGTTGKLNVDASGAAKFEGDEFKSIDAYVEASGASNINVFVSKRLDAKASGASNVDYSGQPTFVNRNESAGANISGQ